MLKGIVKYFTEPRNIVILKLSNVPFYQNLTLNALGLYRNTQCDAPSVMHPVLANSPQNEQKEKELLFWKCYHHHIGIYLWWGPSISLQGNYATKMSPTFRWRPLSHSNKLIVNNIAHRHHQEHRQKFHHIVTAPFWKPATYPTNHQEKQGKYSGLAYL